MPPRFAYWTILIDDAPTAFRARDREELAGIFRQLASRNSNVVIKWFSNGRLWESPEEAKATRRAEPAQAASRGPDWRPGGRHEDPRARFQRGRADRPRRPDHRPPQGVGPADGGSRRPGNRGGPSGDRKPAGKWSRDRSPKATGERRGKPFGDRPGKSFGNRRKPQAGAKPWQRDRVRAKERDERVRKPPRGGGPGDTPVDPEIQPPPQPPGPERPPKPGHEPGPDVPAPETIRIPPEPPERGAPAADNKGGRLIKKRR